MTATAGATPLLGPQTGGSVFTGPTSAHVTSIFWNPAAAGLMEGTHFLLSGGAKLDLTTMSRQAISTRNGEASPSGDKTFSSESDFTAAPGAFAGFTTDFSSSSISIGFAAHLIFSDKTPDLPSGHYHAIGGGLYGPAGSFAVSYRVSRSFYAGAGVTLMFPKLSMSFLRDTRLDACAAPPCDVENPAAAERWDVTTAFDVVPGLSFEPVVGYNGGILYRLGEWWIGVAMDYLFLSAVRKDADVTLTRPDGAILETHGRVAFELPILAHLGIRRPAFGNFELLVNASFARMSTHRVIDVRTVGDPDIDSPEWVVRQRGLSNVISVAAGIEQPPASNVRLGARARFETSAVSTGLLAADRVDAPKLEIAGGVELRLSPKVAIAATASVIAILPVTADPSDFSPLARIDCAASGYDLDTDACVAARDGRAIPTAAGSYWRAGTELNLGVSYDLW